MTLHICIDSWAKSAQGWIQDGAKIGPGGSLLQRTSSSDRKATATYWMHSSDLEVLLVPYRLAGGTLSLLAVCPSVRPSVTLWFSRLFSAVFWDIDLKFGIWICYDIIQIKFEFCQAWRTFTGVIALCLNFVFKTFLCSLFRFWIKIWYMFLLWHNTDQIRVSSRLTYFYRSYCPFLKFCFPDFSLQSFEIFSWNLVYELTLT